MSRPRTIPDADVFAAVCRLLAEGGDKAVAFGSVGRATGLAAPTLVQRYGSREGMVRAALLDAWDRLEARTSAAEAEAKGAAGFLKALTAEDGGADAAQLTAAFRDAALRERALAWRDRVEAILCAHLGGGTKARESAAILFAAWQGQMLWQGAAERTIRLKDMVRRLG